MVDVLSHKRHTGMRKSSLSSQNITNKLRKTHCLPRSFAVSRFDRLVNIHMEVFFIFGYSVTQLRIHKDTKAHIHTHTHLVSIDFFLAIYVICIESNPVATTKYCDDEQSLKRVLGRNMQDFKCEIILTLRFP